MAAWAEVRAALNDAVRLDTDEKWADAAVAYTAAIKHLRAAIACESNVLVRKELKTRLKQYVARLREVDELVSSPPAPSPPPTPSAPTPPPPPPPAAAVEREKERARPSAHAHPALVDVAPAKF